MPRRRKSKGQQAPPPEVIRLLAEARESYLSAAELRKNMPTPFGWSEPRAEVDSSPEQPEG